MWLRKTRLLPGSAPGGHEWKSTDDKVEVDDDLGMALVEIPGAGFEEVPVGEIPSDEPADEAPVADAVLDQTEVSEAPTPKRRGRQPKDATIAPADLGTPVAE